MCLAIAVAIPACRQTHHLRGENFSDIANRPIGECRFGLKVAALSNVTSAIDWFFRNPELQ